MAGNARGVVFGSIGAAGLMALAAVLDLVMKIPFQGQMLLDIMFLLAAALVIYMGIDCLKDSR
ncbi:MAG: hypothetical protein ACK526_02150 [Planctomyces sp.]|jgi:hypothetical protein